jgi:hypothetical protein
MFASLKERPRARLGARLSKSSASRVPTADPVFVAGLQVPLAWTKPGSVV